MIDYSRYQSHWEYRNMKNKRAKSKNEKNKDEHKIILKLLL